MSSCESARDERSSPGLACGHATDRLARCGTLVEFVRDVFGAAGEYDPARPSIVTIGDSKVMISEAGPRDAKTAFLYVYVADPDIVHRRAVERGAKSIEEPFDTPYGDRRCMIEDEWGNAWQVAAYRRA
jgi:hypothetical protein